MKMKGIWKHLAMLTIMAALVLCLLPNLLLTAHAAEPATEGLYTLNVTRFYLTWNASGNVDEKVFLYPEIVDLSITSDNKIVLKFHLRYSETTRSSDFTVTVPNQDCRSEFNVSIDGMVGESDSMRTFIEGTLTRQTQSSHTGGTATCIAKAKCSVCGEEYGEVKTDAHSWGNWTYENGNHNGVCSHNSEHTTSGNCEPGEDGNCTVCNASLAASVHTNDKILYFTDADAALKYAEELYAKTVTILKNATVTRSTVEANLVVNSGVTLTLDGEDHGVWGLTVHGQISGGGTITSDNEPLAMNGCTGCTFNLPVTNYGSVTDGIFSQGLTNYGEVRGGTIYGTLHNVNGYDPIHGQMAVGFVDANKLSLGDGFKYSADEGTRLICSHKYGTPATCVAEQYCPFNCADRDPVNPDAHSLSYADAGNVITETCAHGCDHRATATLNITKDDIIYDGEPQNDVAFVTYSDEWIAGKSLTVGYEGDYTNASSATKTAIAYIKKNNAKATQSFIINKATPTGSHFTITLPQNAVYDGNAKAATVAAADGITGMGTISIAYCKGTKPLNETPTGAGTYTVDLTIAEGDNFTSASLKSAAGFTIKPANMNNVSVSIPGATYSGTKQEPTVTVTGLNGQTMAKTDYTVAWDDESLVNAGTYTATITPTTTNTNYTGSTTATYTIDPKSVSVSGITAKDKVYDGTNTATLDCTNATFDGIVEGDILGVTATGSFIDPNVREDKTVNISDLVLTGEDKANYTLDGRTQQETTTAKVTPKPITATITVPEGNTYGNVQAPTVTFNGVISPDEVTGVLTYDGETNTTGDGHYNSTDMPTRAGEYTVSVTIKETVNDEDYRNYTLTGNTTAQFNIAKAETVKTAPVAITGLVYDSTPKALITAGEASDAAEAAGYNMMYMLEKEGAVYTDTVPTATDAGTYKIIWYAGYDNDNFKLNSGTMEVTIAKADAITTAPTANTLTYNSKPQQLVSGGISNWGSIEYKLDNGDWSYSIPTATNAGSYTVYYRIQLGENFNNVAETAIPVELAPFNFATATAGNAKIGLLGTPFVYDGTAKTGTPSVVVTLPSADPGSSSIEVNLTEGTDFTVDYENNVKAGTFTATFTGKGNYTGVVTRNYEIAKAPLTLTVEDQAITYGESIDQAEYTVTGLATGDTATVTLTPSTDKITKSGSISAEITIKNAAGGDVTGCYTIADNAAKLTIDPDLSAIKDLTVDNVHYSSQSAIKELQTALNGATEDTATQDAISDAKVKCAQLLTQIDASLDALETDAIEDTLQTTASNVKLTDKANVTKAITDIKAAKETYSKNYTDEDKATLDAQIAKLEAALKAIENAEAVIKKMNDLPATAKAEDDASEEIRVAYRKLTEHEKELVKAADSKKMLDAVSYKFISGNGATWESGKTLTFKIDGKFDYFRGVKVDDKAVSTSYYTSKEGSTIVTLKESYMKKVSNRTDHTITFVFEDNDDPGYYYNLNGTFKIHKDAMTPATGDNSGIVLYAVVMLISAAALVGLFLVSKKRNKA